MYRKCTKCTIYVRQCTVLYILCTVRLCNIVFFSVLYFFIALPPTHDALKAAAPPPHVCRLPKKIHQHQHHHHDQLIGISCSEQQKGGGFHEGPLPSIPLLFRPWLRHATSSPPAFSLFWPARLRLRSSPPPRQPPASPTRPPTYFPAAS